MSAWDAVAFLARGFRIVEQGRKAHWCGPSFPVNRALAQVHRQQAATEISKGTVTFKFVG
jgi:hypothetical protein